MKDKIFFALALFFSVANYAQDAIVVKLKDGQELKFPNGIETSTMHFWGTAQEGEEMTSLEAIETERTGTVSDLRVTDFAHRGSEYAVAICWPTDTEMPTAARTGVCIGRQPGVSVESCDSVFFFDSNNAPLTRTSSGQEKWLENVLLGDSLIFFQNGKYQATWPGSLLRNQPDYNQYNWVNYPLQRGQTYYYRVFACVPYEGTDEAASEAIFYAPEQNFRIPNLMADAGYGGGGTFFSDEAWDEFFKHFPEDMTDETRELLKEQTLPTLKAKWEATLEASPYDMTTARDSTFDDGVVHILPAVPEEFWTWMSTREIVVNSQRDIASLYVYYRGERYQQTLIEEVANVEPSWGIPNNSYFVCTPNGDLPSFSGYNSINDSIVVNLTEALPGVRYKLKVTLAPETRYALEKDEEGNIIGDNRSHFLPVRVGMSYIVPVTYDSNPYTGATLRETPWGYIINSRMRRIRFSDYSYFTTDATELSTIELTDIDFSCSVLVINSVVQTSRFNRGEQTNELHIAEVRLTPIIE